MKKTEFSSALLGERYTRFDHPSGLPIFVFPKKLTGTYAIFSTRYGSVDSRFRTEKDAPVTEVPDGIAHFLEHKMFENADGSDSFAKFSSFGADANAYTTYNRTAYLFSCTEHFEESLEELLTFVTHPYFSDASVKKEQGIISEEIGMYEDSPWERCFQQLLEGLYVHNPVRKNICGSKKSIRQITPELLYRCQKAFYNLSNMVLVICGDVDEKAVLSVADRMLPTSPEPFTIERVSDAEPDTVNKPRMRTEMQVEKPIFHLGIKDPVLPKDADERLQRDLKMNLLHEILFSRSGKFYSDLFEEGLLTPSFSAGYSCEDSFAFHCISGESDDPEQIEKRFWDYLDEVKKTGIPEADFERCRRVLYADEIRCYDSTEEIANRLLSFAFDGLDMFNCPACLAAIKKEDLDALLPTFDRAKSVLSLVFPQGTKTKERKEN